MRRFMAVIRLILGFLLCGTGVVIGMIAVTKGGFSSFLGRSFAADVFLGFLGYTLVGLILLGWHFKSLARLVIGLLLCGLTIVAVLVMMTSGGLPEYMMHHAVAISVALVLYLGAGTLLIARYLMHRPV